MRASGESGALFDVALNQREAGLLHESRWPGQMVNLINSMRPKKTLKSRHLRSELHDSKSLMMLLSVKANSSMTLDTLETPPLPKPYLRVLMSFLPTCVQKRDSSVSWLTKSFLKIDRRYSNICSNVRLSVLLEESQ